MKKTTLLLYLTILLLCITNAFAQRNGGIKGTVTTVDSKPVEAVSVGIKNTALGTITNAEGRYQFKS
jgi:iron complex outermembrane receptor protein